MKPVIQQKMFCIYELRRDHFFALKYEANQYFSNVTNVFTHCVPDSHFSGLHHRFGIKKKKHKKDKDHLK